MSTPLAARRSTVRNWQTASTKSDPLRSPAYLALSKRPAAGCKASFHGCRIWRGGIDFYHPGRGTVNSASFQQAAGRRQEDPRKLLLLIQKAPTWRALKELHYKRVCISHPLLSVTVLCNLPNLVLPVHATLTDADIRELQEFVAFLLNNVESSVLKTSNVGSPAPERNKLCKLLIKCLYSLALMDVPDCPRPQWIQRLVAAILDSSDTLTPADVATCLWALGQLPGTVLWNEDILDMADLGIRVLQNEVSNLTLRDTSWTLLGLASLQRSIPTSLVDVVVKHAMALVKVAHQDLELGPPESKHWSWEDDQAAVILQAVCDLLMALVQLNYRPSAQVMDALLEGTDVLLQQSTATAVVPVLLSTVVQLGWSPSEEWMHAYYMATQDELQRTKGQVLAQQAVAVAQIGVSPPMDWLASFAATVSARAPLLQLPELASCCRCMDHFGFQPSAPQLGNIIAALPDAGVLDAHTLFLVLQVYACCSVQPKQALAEKLESTAMELLDEITLDQFGTLVFTISRPCGVAGHQLATRFMPRASVLVQKASPLQLVRFIQALKLANYKCWDKRQSLALVRRLYEVASELSAVQCLEVVEAVAVMGLWPYDRIMAAEGFGSFTGPVRAIPQGLAGAAPLPWLLPLLDGLQQGIGTLQPEQCGTLLSSLSKLALAASEDADGLSQACAGLLAVLEKRVRGRIQEIESVPDICGLCLAFARLRHTPSSTFMMNWSRVVRSKVAAMTAADAVAVLLGLKYLAADFQAAHSGLVEALLRSAVGQIDKSPDDVVEALRLAVDLGPVDDPPAWMRDAALLDVLLQRLKNKWHQMRAAVLAKAIKSLAKIQCTLPSNVLQLHANAMYPQAGTASIPCIADVVWSYGRLGFPLKTSKRDKLLAALAAASRESLQSCDTASLIGSCTELQQRGFGPLPHWPPCIEAALAKDLHALGVADIAAAVAVWEREGHQPAAALADGIAAAMDVLEPGIRSQDAELAADLLRVFAVWGHPVDQRPWLLGLTQHQLGQLREASASRLVSWVWQYHRVRFTPPDDWIVSMLANLQRMLDTLDAPSLRQFVEGTCTLQVWNRLSEVQKHLLLDAVWRRFTSACKEVASTEDVDNFCAMLHSLALVGYTPDTAGRDWLNIRIKQQKKLLPFYTGQQLIWLVGSLTPLGNSNVFMAQEIRGALLNKAADAETLTTPQLGAALAACASAPGPTPARLVEEFKNRILAAPPGGLPSAVPDMVWGLSLIQAQVKSGELVRMCNECAEVAPSFTTQQACRLLAGLADLAGASLWRDEVYGPAATGQLLDQLCSPAVLRCTHTTPTQLVGSLHSLARLGHNPGAEALDGMLKFLTQVDPLARQFSDLMGGPPASPHIQHLDSRSRQHLMGALETFGYSNTAVLQAIAGATSLEDQPTTPGAMAGVESLSTAVPLSRTRPKAVVASNAAAAPVSAAKTQPDVRSYTAVSPTPSSRTPPQQLPSKKTRRSKKQAAVVRSSPAPSNATGAQEGGQRSTHLASGAVATGTAHNMPESKSSSSSPSKSTAAKLTASSKIKGSKQGVAPASAVPGTLKQGMGTISAILGNGIVVHERNRAGIEAGSHNREEAGLVGRGNGTSDAHAVEVPPSREAVNEAVTSTTMNNKDTGSMAGKASSTFDALISALSSVSNWRQKRMKRDEDRG